MDDAPPRLSAPATIPAARDARETAYAVARGLWDGDPTFLPFAAEARFGPVPQHPTVGDLEAAKIRARFLRQSADASDLPGAVTAEMASAEWHYQAMVERRNGGAFDMRAVAQRTCSFLGWWARGGRTDMERWQAEAADV